MQCPHEGCWSSVGARKSTGRQERLARSANETLELYRLDLLTEKITGQQQMIHGALGSGVDRLVGMNIVDCSCIDRRTPKQPQETRMRREGEETVAKTSQGQWQILLDLTFFLFFLLKFLRMV